MNKTVVKVNKIWSYQTLVKKIGKGSFQTKEYKDYQQEISLQINKLKNIEHKNDLAVKLTFNCKNRTVGDIDNITKPILDTLQANNKIFDDRYITELNVVKTFGNKENTIEIEILEKE